MRKSTVIRALALSLLMCVYVGVANGGTTQTCSQECDTAWNQCQAGCQWWNVFCVTECNAQLNDCYDACEHGGKNLPEPTPAPPPV